MTNEQSMLAVRFQGYGGPEVVLLDAAAPRPIPAADEMLVRVHAAGVNPVDWKTREGKSDAMFKMPSGYVPGWDLAGVVEKVGPDGLGFQFGDAVFACQAHAGGAWAYFAAVRPERASIMPASLSFVEAAATPLPALTAWQGLFDHGGLRAGQRVLVHGAGGAVGGWAVQFARLAGAHVIATATEEDRERLQRLGADEVIDYRRDRFETMVDGIDLVLDPLAGETQDRSWAVLRPGGVLVSTLGAPPAAKAVAARARGVGFVAQPSGRQLQRIGELIARGDAHVSVAHAYPLARAPEVLEAGRKGELRGKAVLTVIDSAGDARATMQDRADDRWAPRPGDPPEVLLVKALYAAAHRGDYGAVAQLTHPDCVIYEPQSLPYAGEYRGVRAWEEVGRAIREVFDGFEWIPERFLGSGDTVVMVNRIRGRGKASGAWFEVPMAELITLKDGKTVEVRPFYWDTSAMLAALKRD